MAEKRPFDLLDKGLGKPVLVNLKGGIEVRGTLVSYDVHMNCVLDSAEELKDGETVRKMGSVILRGDNIVFLSV